MTLEQLYAEKGRLITQIQGMQNYLRLVDEQIGKELQNEQRDGARNKAPATDLPADAADKQPG